MAISASFAWLFAAAMAAASPATGARGGDAASAISREPMYADIVAHARQLEKESDAFGAGAKLGLLAQPAFKAYAGDVLALSDADMKGHLDLKARGTDNDLKCIMMGVSLDLPKKLAAIQAATSDAELTTAFGNMSALLSDNVDVIVTPETADSGLDCVIEFGNR